MRKLNCLLGVCCLFALVVISSNRLFAQFVPPPAGPVRRLPNFDIPNVTLLFDRTLDSRGGQDPNTLDFTARRIVDAHRLAQQQVEIAIRFLERNREAIIKGEIPEFNVIFGNVAQRNPAVVLSSRPISGVFEADMNNPLLLTFDGITLASPSAQLASGDRIYFTFASAPGQPPPDTGFTATVQDVLLTNASGGAGAIVLQNALVNAQGFPINTDLIGQIWKIQRVEQRGDPSRFDQVLNTFRSIRLALQGVNPNQGGNLSQNPPQPITYNGLFRDISSFYGAGAVSVPGLGLRGYPADKLTREAGFSNSDSSAHIQDIPLVAAGSPRPLLWTNDNAPSFRQIVIRNANNPSLPPTAIITNTPPTSVFPQPGGALAGGQLGGDISRTFFFDRQTIFGAPDNPNQQFVGYAFILDRINHFANFQDNGIALAPGSSVIRPLQALNAAGAPLQDVNGNPITTLVETPDTGNPLVQNLNPTDDWKEIVRSFAEFSTFTFPRSQARGGAFTGVQDILGSSVAGPLSSLDASNYARFADFFRSDPGGLGFGGNIEPFGKRGTAGFNPIVPLR